MGGVHALMHVSVSVRFRRVTTTRTHMDAYPPHIIVFVWREVCAVRVSWCVVCRRRRRCAATAARIAHLAYVGESESRPLRVS